MKNKTYLLNTILAAVLGVLLLAAVLVRTFAPAILLPRPDVPNLVLVSLAALIADHYLAPGAKRRWLWAAVLAAVSFGLLPWAACFVGGPDALRLGILGGAVFTVTAWLFTTAQDRLSTGPAAKAAPLLTALGLYLSAQCFAGWML